MQTRFRIEVTKKDIDKAHVGDSYKCVVMQAIARSIPNAHRIEVDVQTVRFSAGDRRLVYLTPFTVQQYVVGFDAGDEIRPFSFRLDAPILKRRGQLTPSHKAAQTAAVKAKRRAKQRLKNGDTTADPRAEGKAAYAAVRATLPEEHKHAEPVPKSDRTPRMFKTKRRTYGHRVLRINRSRAAATPPLVEDDPPF